jgi:hypothetical protein
MMDDYWQEQLIARHPQLFIRSYRGLPFSPGYPACPDGWSEIVATVVKRVSKSATGYWYSSVRFRSVPAGCKSIGKRIHAFPSGSNAALKTLLSVARHAPPVHAQRAEQRDTSFSAPRDGFNHSVLSMLGASQCLWKMSSLFEGLLESKPPLPVISTTGD